MQKVSLLHDWARVGRFLVREKRITPRQLRIALTRQHEREGGLIGEICIELGFCTTQDVEHAVACRAKSMLERKPVTEPAMQAFRDQVKRIKVATREYATQSVQS